MFVWRTRRSSSMKYRDVPVRMTSTGGAHRHSLTDGWSLCNRSLNQSSWSWTSSYTTYDVVQDHLFWRILCQIRNIKYCAEPSVRESPKHEGSLLRGDYLWVSVSMPPASTGRTSSAIRRLTTALESSCYSYVPRSQMKTTLLPNEVHEEVSVYSTRLVSTRYVW